jgi:hypothetical protein
VSIRKEISTALRAAGYERSGRGHLRRLADEFAVVVDTGPVNDTPAVSPWIGLRHDRTERLQAQFMELPADDFSATAGANVGLILGQGYLTWHEGDEASVIDAIGRSADVLARFATLPGLGELWSRRLVPPPRVYKVVPYRIVCGDFAVVDAVLVDSKKAECLTEGPVCEQFRRFDRNARAFMTNT